VFSLPNKAGDDSIKEVLARLPWQAHIRLIRGKKIVASKKI
jgi:hypothetical protein